MKLKRAKRRDKRAHALGPEMDIVATSESTGEHALECGHVVDKLHDERPGIKRVRCYKCLPIIQRLRYMIRNRRYWSLDALIVVSFLA